MNEPTDLDIRITAMAQEYETTIASLTRRAATLAAELASAQAKVKAAEDAAKAEAASEKESLE